MARHATSETTLRDVYRALFRHKGKAGGFFVAVMTAVLLAIVFLPKVYRSEGKLFVRLGRENATLDPTASPGQERVVLNPASREHEINSVVEILGSRVLLERVVDAVGPAAILDQQGDSAPSEDPPANLAMASIGPVDAPDAAAGSGKEGWLEQFSLVTPLSDRERAVAELKGNLAVEPARKSNVIVVSYESHSPKLSQAVVARLIDLYLHEHVRLNRTSGACGFFDEQASRLRSELSEAQEQLRDLKNETGLAVPERQRELIVERIGRLEDELLRTSEEMAAAESRVRRLREKLDGLDEVCVAAATSGMGNDGTDRMRQQLYDLQLREQEMLAKYTDQHPRMREIREQTAAARQIFRREEATRTEVTKGPSRTFEEAQIELLREEPQLASLGSRAETLRAQLAGVRGELRSLNENELRIARLNREVELREADYRKYAANLEQARIDEALESERISNITIAQPATLESKPVRPRVLLGLILGLVVGLGGGLGLALTAECLDRSFRGPEDIEKKLELPALVSIPRLHRRQLTHNGKRCKHGH